MLTKNKLATLNNPYQGKAKKVLCLCSAGLLRSPTMANVLHQEYGYNTRAAGVTQEYALIHVSEALLVWADEIICADHEVEFSLKRNWGEELPKATPVYNLHIPDEYEWNNADLRLAIKDAYEQRKSSSP